LIPTDPNAVFTWLLQAGAAALIISFLAERSTWFQSLSPTVRYRLTFVVFTFLPLTAFLGLFLIGSIPTLPADWHAWVSLILGYLIQGFFSWVISIYAHDSDPKVKEARREDQPPPQVVTVETPKGVSAGQVVTVVSHEPQP